MCAAKYKEYVKRDEKAMQVFRNALLSTDQLEVPVSLDGETLESVTFVKVHMDDIRTILEALEAS